MSADQPSDAVARRFTEEDLSSAPVVDANGPAAQSGVVIPLLMRRLGIDPTLADSVVLTTVTDIVGFFAFPELATLILL
ncbi:magnesium transporter [Thiocapsa sp.]|uniref:magnesium transporter n=1 Tax=Thiocapsa sp. TaxID=2024551 RepID=UPI0035932682